MTRLCRLHTEQGQSPWLDNLTRDSLDDGSLQELIESGIRGVTANPSIFSHAMAGSDAYTNQLCGLVHSDTSMEHSYWELVVTDVTRTADLFRPLYDSTDGGDGFVSVEVSPDVADDCAATIDAAEGLHRRIDRANLMVKIPATDAGARAIEAMTAAGRSINITLIFSLTRYSQVIDAYMSGLETLLARGGDSPPGCTVSPPSSSAEWTPMSTADRFEVRVSRGPLFPATYTRKSTSSTGR